MITDVHNKPGEQVPGWKPLPFTQKKRISMPTRKEKLKIHKQDKITPREKESYSSISTLIQYPFDWVFQYALQIRPGYTFELKDVETTLGDVAHNMIHDLFTAHRYSLPDIRKALDQDYERLLDEAIVKYGAILLLTENTNDLQRLKYQLRKSILTLLEIIEENGLTLTGSEVEMAGETYLGAPGDNQTLTGKIDLMLEEKNGEKVVIDMKWTSYKKRYIDKFLRCIFIYGEAIVKINGRCV